MSYVWFSDPSRRDALLRSADKRCGSKWIQYANVLPCQYPCIVCWFQVEGLCSYFGAFREGNTSTGYPDYV